VNATHSVLDQDLITRLIARERGEEPVITIYMKTAGADRRAVLKNLIKDGEAAITADTGWDAERKKIAARILESLRGTAETLVEAAHAQKRGSFALFADADGTQTVNLPLEMRDRIVVDRSPYASPLSSLIDQYERYGVVICDQKRARLFDVYLGEVSDWEELEGEHERSRHAPAGGPARRGGGKGLFHGLEELRRKNHSEYVLHLHLQSVADRAFRRYKLRPFDRLILCGPKEMLPKLEEHMHSYLKQRVAAREHLAVDLSPADARERILEVEKRVEREKEATLLAEIRDRHGKQGLASAGVDETLRSLFYGKVKTLVVMDEAIMGRECPECHYLFEWPEDEWESTPTLVECPVCKRPTRRVPDLVDEAVELAILSGARVEHVSYAQEELKDMGNMAAVLRFK
jgi:peptide subunit release factor 1 (eRF1)